MVMVMVMVMVMRIRSEKRPLRRVVLRGAKKPDLRPLGRA